MATLVLLISKNAKLQKIIGLCFTNHANYQPIAMAMSRNKWVWHFCVSQNSGSAVRKGGGHISHLLFLGVRGLPGVECFQAFNHTNLADSGTLLQPVVKCDRSNFIFHQLRLCSLQLKHINEIMRNFRWIRSSLFSYSQRFGTTILRLF